MNLAVKHEVITTSADKVQAMLEDHLRTTEAFFTKNTETIVEVSKICAERLAKGNKIMLCGNGGSAADAQHIAAEFVGRFKEDRLALPSIALTTDTSAITAIGNDYGYDNVFSRQVEGLGVKGDILIGITTSGNSANVLKAFDSAKKKGLITVLLAGRDGGKAKGTTDYEMIVDYPYSDRIQECHITVMHMMCELIEDFLDI